MKTQTMAVNLLVQTINWQKKKINITIQYVGVSGKKMWLIFQNLNIAIKLQTSSALRQKLLHPKADLGNVSRPVFSTDSNVKNPTAATYTSARPTGH